MSRPYVKIADVNDGTVLVPDHIMSECMIPGVPVTVIADDEGDLFIPCKDGNHYLDGQLDGDFYIGFGLSEKKT